MIGTFSGGGLGFGLTFTLNDAFSGVADRIQARFDRLQAQTSVVSDRIEESFGKVAAGAALVGTGLALLAPVGLGIKFAGEFEAAEIRLTTLLKSADKAKEAFANIKIDAAATPFGTQELLSANTLLIATGMSAEQARADVLHLGNAIAATGGTSADLTNMAVNLQGIRNVGKAEQMDIKQFGLTGIPIYQMLADVTGKTVAEVKKMDITYDVLMQSMAKAAGVGGMFEGAMDRLSKSVNGKLATLSDGFKFAMAAIGKAVLPMFHAILDAAIGLFGWFEEFSQTTLGKLVIQLGLASLAFLALGVVIVGLKLVFWALVPAIWAALSPLLPFVAAILLIAAYIWFFMHALEKFNDYFKSFQEGLEKPVKPTGFIGFMVRIGGVMKGVMEIFRNMTDAGWTMSGELEAALEELGVLDLVIAIGTWMVRIRALFQGIKEAITDFWYHAVKPVTTWINDAVDKVFDKLGIRMDKNTSSMLAWKRAGYALGIGMVLTFLPLLLLIGLVVLVVWLLYAAITIVIDNVMLFYELCKFCITWIIDGIKSMVKSMIEAFDEFVAHISQVGTAAYNSGASWVSNLWEGIKSKWGSFKSWLDKEIEGIPILGAIYGVGKDIAPDVSDRFSGEDTGGRVTPQTVPVTGGQVTPQTVPVSRGQQMGIGVAQNRANMYSPNIRTYNTIQNDMQPEFNVYLGEDKLTDLLLIKVEDKQAFNASR